MEIVLVLLITAGAIYLYVTERYPSALVSMMVLALLMLVALVQPWLTLIRPDHWITPVEGVSGFSNPATVTVAAMFVLSAGLQRTGAISWVGPSLDRITRYPTLLLLVMMVAICFISAFINNTAAVAVFLPIVLAASSRGGTAPSKLLIPLSFASQFGGVCTLIGTSTNLLVSSISQQAGHGTFGMFEFTRMGLILTGAGLVYLVIVSRWVLPEREGRGLVQSYQVSDYVTELRITANSPLAGKTVREAKLAGAQPARLLAILREGRAFWPSLETVLERDDVLLVQAPASQFLRLRNTWKLESEPEFRFADDTLRGQELSLAEAIVSPQSSLIGQTLQEVDFRRRYRCLVLGHRGRERVSLERLGASQINFGDALLLLGPRDELNRLRNGEDLLMLERIEEPALRRSRVPLAVGIFVMVIALAALKVVPLLASALFGCVALVATRCLTLEEACEAIDWKVILLLAGALPLGMVVEKSGAADLLAHGAVALAGPWGPLPALAALYFVAAALTAFMSNSATAVLLAPVAIAIADSLGVHSRPFLMAVCFAASTCYCTPVGYQTNAMVQHPGGYRFADFLWVGLPLNILFWGLSVAFIPRFWPF